MKKIFTAVLCVLFSLHLSAQCTPGDATSCPDPENNGEICPKILATGYVGQPYSQEVTILPPPTTEVGGSTLNLHKIRVTAINNMPPGLSYQSNSPNNDFLVGTYYCFLISGTPTQAGHYPLKIHVDAYVMLMGNPTLLGSQIDSTSLYIDVDNQVGVLNYTVKGLKLISASPNPFVTNWELDFYSPGSQTIDFKMYTTAGQLVYEERFDATLGHNTFIFNGEGLAAGLYHYHFTGHGGSIKGIVIKQ